MTEFPYCPVLSLVVRSVESPERVLLGVRRPTATSHRHPRVLSTPTMRVPSELMDVVLAAVPSAPQPPSLGCIEPISGASPAVIGAAMSLREPVGFLVEALLSRKLGMGEGLVAGEISGWVRAVALAHDVVHDPGSDGAPERTLMLSVSVLLKRGLAQVPPSSSSYERLAWVPAAGVAAAVQKKDVFALLPDASLDVCLHGLCVRSAAAVLEAGDGDGLARD